MQDYVYIFIIPFSRKMSAHRAHREQLGHGLGARQRTVTQLADLAFCIRREVVHSSAVSVGAPCGGNDQIHPPPNPSRLLETPSFCDARFT